MKENGAGVGGWVGGWSPGRLLIYSFLNAELKDVNYTCPFLLLPPPFSPCSFFSHSLLSVFFLIESRYVAEGSLELRIFLLPSPKHWAYRAAPSHPVVSGVFI